MNKTYMLDTCICSFIMREQPETVLKRLEQATCLVTALWSRPLLTLKCASVDATTDIKVALHQAGTPIGQNDTAIAEPEAGRLGKLTSPTL